MRPANSQRDPTRLLLAARQDGSASFDELFRLVYDELYSLAASYFRSERIGHTLQPTALVNEAYVRLIRKQDVEWSDRNHFFAVAATCIRRILMEQARRRGAVKRGAGIGQVTLYEHDEPATSGVDVELLDLDQALKDLETRDTRRARVVELRYFGGLSVEDVASTLGVSAKTVKNDWRFSRAWLFSRLDPGGVE